MVVLIRSVADGDDFAARTEARRALRAIESK
jgi:hypothetical protein